MDTSLLSSLCVPFCIVQAYRASRLSLTRLCQLQEPRKSDAPQLRDEYRSYRILQGCPGIPQAYYYGTEGLHNVLCIDLLGPNLEDLFDLVRCGRSPTTPEPRSYWPMSCLAVWAEIHNQNRSNACQTNGTYLWYCTHFALLLNAPID
jgi:hypothetical protein